MWCPEERSQQKKVGSQKRVKRDSVTWFWLDPQDDHAERKKKSFFFQRSKRGIEAEKSLKWSSKMPLCRFKSSAAVLAEALATFYSLISKTVEPCLKRLCLYLMECFFRMGQHGKYLLLLELDKRWFSWTFRCKMANFKNCLWGIKLLSLRLCESFLDDFCD